MKPAQGHDVWLPPYTTRMALKYFRFLFVEPGNPFFTKCDEWKLAYSRPLFKKCEVDYMYHEGLEAIFKFAVIHHSLSVYGSHHTMLAIACTLEVPN